MLCYAYGVGDDFACLTSDECRLKGGYLHSYECLTPKQCRTKKNMYAYRVIGSCLSNVPANGGGFVESLSAEEEYACSGNDYLDISTSTARCISGNACAVVVHDKKPLCMSRENCCGYPYWSFLDFNGIHTECVGTISCEKLGKFAYVATGECSNVSPDTEHGNFMPTYTSEKAYRCVADFPYLQLADAGRCVTAAECRYGRHRYVTAGKACVSREAWLAEEGHFVGVALEGEEHADRAAAAAACGRVPGASLLLGRICACPDDAYYSHAEKRCIGLADSLREGLLPFALEYRYGEEDRVQYYQPLSREECLSGTVPGTAEPLAACDGLYLAPDLRACTDYGGGCTAYFFSFPFDEDRRLCISLDECRQHGGFVCGDSVCYTAPQCRARGLHAYRYAETGVCSSLPPEEEDFYPV